MHRKCYDACKFVCFLNYTFCRPQFCAKLRRLSGLPWMVNLRSIEISYFMFFSHNQHHFCSKNFRLKDSSNLNMFRKNFHVLFFPEVLSITFTRVWMHKKMYNFQGHLFSKQILVSIGQAKTYILYIYEYSIYLVISYSLSYNGVFWGLLWIINQNENVQKIY